MQQAEQAGQKIKQAMDSDGQPYNLFFYTSPYKRSRQTHDSVSSCFAADQLKGVQEEVQLREQDFGNFQVSYLHDAHDTKHLCVLTHHCQCSQQSWQGMPHASQAFAGKHKEQ